MGSRLAVAAVALVVSLVALGWAAGYEPGRSTPLPAGPRPAAASATDTDTEAMARTDTHAAARTGTGDRVDGAPAAQGRATETAGAGTVAASGAVWHFLAGPVAAEADAFDVAWRHAFDTRAASSGLVVGAAATRLAATLRAHAGALDRLQWTTPDLTTAAQGVAAADRAHAEALDAFAAVVGTRWIERAVGAYLEVRAADEERGQRWFTLTVLLHA